MMRIRVSYYHVLLIGIFLRMLTLSSCHSVWSCPKPRDPRTDLKVGPCGYPGDQGPKFGEKGVTKMSPGKHIVTFAESIIHKGSPFRISLAKMQTSSDLDSDLSDFSECILLDHIPHFDFDYRSVNSSLPSIVDESTWSTYAIEIDIPDVQCDRCVLQLLYVMSDKSGGSCGFEPCNYDGKLAECTPQDGQIAEEFKESCKRFTANSNPSILPCPQGACFSNYHSCADIKIDGGSKSWEEFQCSQPPAWPYLSLPREKYYGNESVDWNLGASTIATAPVFLWDNYDIKYVERMIGSTATCPKFSEEDNGGDANDEKGKKKKGGVGGLIFGIVILILLIGIIYVFRKSLYEGFKPWFDKARDMASMGKSGLKLPQMT